MNIKPATESRTVQATIILPNNTNNHGTVFGGTVMAYIDEVAAIAAMRHSRKNVVTASIDSVDFLAPAKMGDSLCVEAFVSSTGRTSMEVFVKVISENLLTGSRELTATSFVTFVALDENGRPTPVPSVKPETEEEILLYNTAQERQQKRKDRLGPLKQLNAQLDISKNI